MFQTSSKTIELDEAGGECSYRQFLWVTCSPNAITGTATSGNRSNASRLVRFVAQLLSHSCAKKTCSLFSKGLFWTVVLQSNLIRSTDLIPVVAESYMTLYGRTFDLRVKSKYVTYVCLYAVWGHWG